MSNLFSVRPRLGQPFFQPGACIQSRVFFKPRNTSHPGSVRCASQAKRPPKSPKDSSCGKTTQRRGPEPYVRKRQIDPTKKISFLLNRASSAKKNPSSGVQSTASSMIQSPAKIAEAQADANIEAPKTVEIDEKELAIQKKIVENRRKLLWPGIWSVFAIAGTYGILAYQDARSSASDSTLKDQPCERIQIPQSWFLTPTVIKEGIKAGWQDLDKLTIGIVVASIGMHLLKRSPLPIWEKLIHITGEKKYTAFTYPLVHYNWAHLGSNMFGLCWFLPGVVHYFDGNLFHTAALLVSVPLITSYLSHFVFRLGLVQGMALNLGSSGAVAAILGAFCVAYPDEKVWVPNFFIFRFDAKYCCALYTIWQIACLLKAPTGGVRPAFLVHTMSLGLGAAYVYFDGKENVWKPLVALLAKVDDTSA